MYNTVIHIQGKIDPCWSDWFGEMQITCSSTGDSVMIGNLPDRASVYGIISRLSSLGMTLISVTCQEEKIDIPP